MHLEYTSVPTWSTKPIKSAIHEFIGSGKNVAEIVRDEGDKLNDMLITLAIGELRESGEDVPVRATHKDGRHFIYRADRDLDPVIGYMLPRRGGK